MFQVNLAQSLSRKPTTLTAAELYHRLPPATFGGMIDLGDLAIISNSPELFLHVDAAGRVETRPIKGTRPAGTTAGELLDSEKDAAELNMIVDLERNDLGRVCEVGSVRVAAPRSIELHPTVQHGVATVVGQLRRGRRPRRTACGHVPQRKRDGCAEDSGDADHRRASSRRHAGRTAGRSAGSMPTGRFC